MMPRRVGEAVLSFRGDVSLYDLHDLGPKWVSGPRPRARGGTGGATSPQIQKAIPELIRRNNLSISAKKTYDFTPRQLPR